MKVALSRVSRVGDDVVRARTSTMTYHIGLLWVFSLLAHTLTIAITYDVTA